MAATVVQNVEGTSLLATTSPAFSAATAGNLLVLVAGADDYKTGDPSGYTLSTGCSQQTFLGHYLWWKVAAGGETSVSYTIGSASASAWEVFEISGLTASPYDVSNGQFAQVTVSSYTTPAITPTTGDRFLLASMGGSRSGLNFTGVDTWLNSFTELNDTFTTAATRDIIGTASRSVTGDGVTTFSSGCTYSVQAESTTGIIIAFKVAGAVATVTPPRRRGPNYRR